MRGHGSRQQKGYSLLAVVVLLSLFAVIALQFLDRTTKSIQISGYARDSAESLVLAEAAMNTLYGSFVYDADLDGANGPDNLTTVNTKPGQIEISLPYMYFVNGGAGVDQTAPSLLQRIADGEAAAQGGAVNNHGTSAARLRIDNLFQAGNAGAPIMFVHAPDEPAKLKRVTTTWSATNATRKAAAWLELTKNPLLDGTYGIYVQAAAQVGDAKAYVQRFAGTMTDTLGRRVGALNESKPIAGN